jgi:hypothetical protein
MQDTSSSESVPLPPPRLPHKNRDISTTSSDGNGISPHDAGLPDLGRCLQVLQSLNDTNISPNTLAEQYTAAVGLLLHLRRDQQR